MSEKAHPNTMRPKRSIFRIMLDVVVYLGALLMLFGINSFLAGNTVPLYRAIAAGRETAVAIGLIVLYVAASAYIWRQYQDYQLSGKLVVAFVGVSFVIVMGISQVVTRVVRSSLTEDIGAALTIETGGLRNEVDLFFHEKAGQIQTLVLIDSFKEQLAERNASYSGSAADIQAEIEQLDEQWLVASDDDPLITQVTSANADINPLAFQLYDYLEAFPQQTELFITDRYGATVAATGRLSDYYQADEEWWQAAWNDGQGAIYISEPQYDASADIMAILIAVPIVSEEENEILGIARSTVDARGIFAILDRFQRGETGYAFLLNGAGEIIGDSAAENETSDAALSEAIRQQVLEQNVNTVIGLDEAGEETIFGSAPLHSEADAEEASSELNEQLAEAIHSLDWVVVIRQSTAEAFATVNTISATIALASLGAIIASGVMGYIIANHTVQPIKQLSAVAQAVGEGELDTALPQTGQDEIGVLVNSFGQMIGRLKDSLANLQARNRDLDLASEIGRELARTRELATTLRESAEVIRERYGLYYAQIYLLDPSGRHLILRAGTGETGRLLVQRGHRLVIGPGSLNGMAAARRAPVIVADTERSESHRPNPLLPDTRSELAIPLVAGDELVGILDLQSDAPNFFAESSVVSFEALAAQLAIAIQNAALFTETQAARAETEQYTRRLLNEGWQGFLNGIERQEKMVAAYDISAELPLQEVDETPANLDQLAVPIQLAGLPIGHIRLEDKGERGWTEQETEILRAVADKVANHLENLRLLAEAEQYRRQMEEVTRRLTREHWQDYLISSRQQNLGFVYEQNQVVDLVETEPQADLKRSLSVDGEIIGEIALSGLDELDEDAQVILHQVITKASNRLWTLHLVEQTEQALTQTEAQAEQLRQLNELGNALSETQTMNEAFAAVAQHVRGIIKQERMSATLLDRDKQKLELYAVDGRPGPIALGASYPVQGTAIGECVTRQKIMRLADLSASDYLENKGLLEQGLRSTLIVPLVSGRTVLGTLNMASSRVNAFDEQDEALLLQIAPLLASTIESQRLYAEAREQARRERMLNTIGQKIRGTVTLESALQTAVQEMARALDVPYAQLRMSTGRPEGAEEMLPLTPADMLPPWLDDDNDELQG